MKKLISVLFALMTLAALPLRADPLGPDFFTRAALGGIDGVTSVRYHGNNGTTTTTHETLWDESTLYAFLGANMATPTISSASTNDAAAGTGARTVRITGCAATTYALVTEDLILNGQTGVSLVNAYMTINSMEVLTAGSGGVNAGLIYVGTGSITTGKPAVVHGVMAAGMNKSTSLVGCVPANYSLVLYPPDVKSKSATTGGHETWLRTSTNLGLLNILYIGGFLNVGMDSSEQLPTPVVLPEKTQWQLTVASVAGTGPVLGSVVGLLVENRVKYLFGGRL